MLPDDDKRYAIKTCRSSEKCFKKVIWNKRHTISAFVGSVIFNFTVISAMFDFALNQTECKLYPCCNTMHKLVTSTWFPWNCCSQSSVSNMSTVSTEVYSPTERSVKWRMYDACCATIATVSTKYKVRLPPWRKGLKYVMELISTYANTIILL